MNTPDAELLKKNRRIDQKVISAIDALRKQLPESAQPKQGSDYRLSPPFGGKALTSSRCGKEI